MRILGLDPGLATTGFGIIETHNNGKPEIISYGTIQTKAGMPLGARLGEIRNDFETLLTNYKPSLCVIEKLFFGNNITTGIPVAHARGIIFDSLYQNHVEVIEMAPSELKLALTGDGSAKKPQMQQMIQLLLKLDAIPKPDDAADGIALALAGQTLKNSLKQMR